MFGSSERTENASVNRGKRRRGKKFECRLAQLEQWASGEERGTLPGSRTKCTSSRNEGILTLCGNAHCLLRCNFLKTRLFCFPSFLSWADVSSRCECHNMISPCSGGGATDATDASNFQTAEATGANTACIQARITLTSSDRHCKSIAMCALLSLPVPAGSALVDRVGAGKWMPPNARAADDREGLFSRLSIFILPRETALPCVAQTLLNYMAAIEIAFTRRKYVACYSQEPIYDVVCLRSHSDPHRAMANSARSEEVSDCFILRLDDAHCEAAN